MVLALAPGGLRLDAGTHSGWPLFEGLGFEKHDLSSLCSCPGGFSVDAGTHRGGPLLDESPRPVSVLAFGEARSGSGLGKSSNKR